MNKLALFGWYWNVGAMPLPIALGHQFSKSGTMVPEAGARPPESLEG